MSASYRRACRTHRGCASLSTSVRNAAESRSICAALNCGPRSNHTADALDQPIAGEWLDEIRDGSCLYRAPSGSRLVIRGHEYDGTWWMRRSQSVVQLEASHAGQMHVENETRRVRPGRGLRATLLPRGTRCIEPRGIKHAYSTARLKSASSSTTITSGCPDGIGSPSRGSSPPRPAQDMPGYSAPAVRTGNRTLGKFAALEGKGSATRASRRPGHPIDSARLTTPERRLPNG